MNKRQLLGAGVCAVVLAGMFGQPPPQSPPVLAPPAPAMPAAPPVPVYAPLPTPAPLPRLTPQTRQYMAAQGYYSTNTAQVWETRRKRRGNGYGGYRARDSRGRFVSSGRGRR